MADLYIDFAGLERTRNDLERISGLLHAPLAAMADRAGAVTEIDVLRSRLVEFGEAWDHGIGKLAEYADGAGAALTQIKQTFDELDAKLAETFEQVS